MEWSQDGFKMWARQRPPPLRMASKMCFKADLIRKNQLLLSQIFVYMPYIYSFPVIGENWTRLRVPSGTEERESGHV